MRWISAFLLALVTAACGDGSGPLSGLSLCPAATWAGMQREGGDWKTIPAIRSAVSLNPGEHIGLARVRHGFQTDTLQIFYVSAEQAESTFPCVAVPNKELHGTVSGASNVAIRIAGSGASSGTILNDYTLHGVADGPVDLVATRLDDPPAAIIRRAVNYPTGSEIPLLDFASAESFNLQPNTITVGNTNNVQFAAQNQIITQNGTLGLLDFTGASTGSTLTIYSVPESKLANGELQMLTVNGPVAREATVFYRQPGDRSIDLGPSANAPVVTRTAAPDVSFHIDVPSQPEYGSQIVFDLCLPQSGFNSVGSLLATKEYFGGTPATWSFDIPDLKSVSGFPTSWPDPRLGGVCTTIVSSRPYLLTPRTARDGDSYRSAGSD